MRDRGLDGVAQHHRVEREPGPRAIGEQSLDLVDERTGVEHLHDAIRVRPLELALQLLAARGEREPHAVET